MDTPPSPATPRPAPAPLPPARRRRGWLRALLLLALAGPVAGALVLWHSQVAWAWLLARAPGVTLQGARGSLGSGRIEIDQLTWRGSGGAQLRLQRLAIAGIALRPWGAPIAVALGSVRADAVHWQPATSATPAVPPRDLRLPLALQIELLQVGTIETPGVPPLLGLQARLALGAERGTRHVLVLHAARVERARIAGQATLDADAPLALHARLGATADGASPWSAEARADGPLERLALAVQATRAGAAAPAAARLQAQAELRPFAAWPLGTLRAEGHDVDLASWSSRWPHTALHGQAALDTHGLERPAQARLELENRLPGPWDQARLPLQRAQLALQGTPQRADDLRIERLALQLGDGRGAAGTLDGTGRWHDDRLELALTLRALQPARLDTRAAPMRLDGTLTLDASTRADAPRAAVQGQLDGRALDGSGTPVQLQLDLAGDAQAWHLRTALARAGSARLSASGNARRADAGWDLQLETALADFDPHPWWRGSAEAAAGSTRLTARLQAQGRWLGWPAQGAAVRRLARAWHGQLSVDVTDSRLAGVPWAGQARLDTTHGSTEARLQLRVADANALGVQAHLGSADDDPADWLALQAQWPRLAAAQPWLNGAAAMGLAPPALRELALAGALQAQARFEGRWPMTRTQGDLQLQDLRAGALAVAQADAHWRAGAGAGTGADEIQAQLTARAATLGAWRLDRAELHAQGTAAEHRIELSAEGPARPPAWTESLLGPLGNGTRLEASLVGAWQRPAPGGGAATLAGAGAREVAAAGAGQWQWRHAQLRAGARGAPADTADWLHASGLSGRLWLDSAGRPLALQADPGRVQGPATGLRWSAASWQRAAAAAPGTIGHDRLRIQGELETFDVAPLLQRLQPGMGWSGDLAVGGRVDIDAADRFETDVVIERLRGDLAVADELGARLPLGLSELRLALGAREGLWQFAQGLAGDRIGQVGGAQLVRTRAGSRWPDAQSPLQGVIEARVDQLGAWGAWVPPGWRLAGSVHTSATLDGTLGAPQLRGSMRGSALGLRNVLQGVNLVDGDLAIDLQGDTARIEQLRLRGGDGWLTVHGAATLGEQPQARLQLKAERFRVLGRVDRRVVVSGDAELRLQPRQLQAGGRLRVDEGLIDVSRSDAPALDSDVHVANGTAAAASAAGPGSGNGSRAGAPAGDAAAAPRTQVDIDLGLDLGQALRLHGRGLDTGLRGQVRLTSPGGQAAWRGTVHTEGGTYAAYGQKLEIERGELHFEGAPDNPRLDVLAIRPNLDVRVGVAITGTALNPRVRLTSEPELAEMDKLAWLVLGRGPEGLGRADTALLQRAAVALLAGDGAAPTDALFDALGLTDFSVRQSDGDVRETVVSLGKQLSRRWYVGYERSVNATAGTWQLVYRVARRFTLRAQTGHENSLDMIWTWRW